MTHKSIRSLRPPHSWNGQGVAHGFLCERVQTIADVCHERHLASAKNMELLPKTVARTLTLRFLLSRLGDPFAGWQTLSWTPVRGPGYFGEESLWRCSKEGAHRPLRSKASKAQSDSDFREGGQRHVHGLCSHRQQKSALCPNRNIVSCHLGTSSILKFFGRRTRGPSHCCD